MVPNLFLTVAHFDSENYPWPTLKALDPNFPANSVLNQIETIFPAEDSCSPKKKKGLHQHSSVFSGRKRDLQKKGLHQNSSGLARRIQVISRNQKLQTRLFQNTTFTKMLRGPLQNGPVAHRLKSAALNLYKFGSD